MIARWEIKHTKWVDDTFSGRYVETGEVTRVGGPIVAYVSHDREVCAIVHLIENSKLIPVPLGDITVTED